MSEFLAMPLSFQSLTLAGLVSLLWLAKARSVKAQGQAELYGGGSCRDWVILIIVTVSFAAFVVWAASDAVALLLAASGRLGG